MVTKKYKKKAAPKAAPKAAAVVNETVEAKEVKACGCDSSCCCDGNCKCHESCSSWLTFIGLVLIALAVLAAPFVRGLKCPCKGKAPAAPQATTTNADAIRSFIKANPAFIIETLNNHAAAEQRKNARKAPPKEADAAMVKEILEDKTNTVLGNPKGSFVVIEFFDYQCGYCKMMNKKLAEAVKKSDNIRWVVMDNPIFGEKSEIISRYALASAKQGKFKAFHEALADNKDMSEAGLIALGKKVGLDTDKLTKDANSEELKKKILKTREYTRKLNLGGVPMFIIDGKIQAGAFSDEKMDEYIKQANEMKAAKKAKK